MEETVRNQAEALRQWYSRKGVKILRRISQDRDQAKKGFLNSRKAILAVLIPVASAAVIAAFFWLVFENPVARQWMEDAGMVGIALLLLYVLTILKKDYPEQFTDRYGESFVDPLTKQIIPNSRFTVNEGLTPEEFLSTKLPLIQNVDALAAKIKKRSTQVYRCFGEWTVQDAASTSMNAIAFGVLGKKDGFVYKGFLLRTLSGGYTEGRHYLFSDTFAQSLGKAAGSLQERQRVADPVLGEGWTQYSNAPLTLSEDVLEILHDSFDRFNVEGAPGVFLIIRGSELVVWYDWNKLGYDPLIMTPKSEERQLTTLFDVLTSAKTFFVRDELR